MTPRAPVRGRSSPRVLALVVLLVCAVLAGLVAVSRYEGRRHTRAEIAAMSRVIRVVGQLDNPSLDEYRIDVDFAFDCLLYRRGSNPGALELCFDRSGRVVEAIDRRGGELRIASLREDPDASTIRYDRGTIVRLLKRLGAPPPRGGWR